MAATNVSGKNQSELCTVGDESLGVRCNFDVVDKDFGIRRIAK